MPPNQLLCIKVCNLYFHSYLIPEICIQSDQVSEDPLYLIKILPRIEIIV